MLLKAGATVDMQQKVRDCYYDSTLFTVTCSVPLAVFIVHYHTTFRTIGRTVCVFESTTTCCEAGLEDVVMTTIL